MSSPTAPFAPNAPTRPSRAHSTAAVRHCLHAAAAAQVVKVVFPVYYGSVYLMTKVPQHVFMRGMQHLDEARESGSTDTAAAADGAAAAALADSCEVLPSSPLGAQRGSKLHRRSCAADIAVQASPLLQQPLLA